MVILGYVVMLAIGIFIGMCVMGAICQSNERQGISNLTED